MVQIIEENRHPSFSDRLFAGGARAAGDLSTQFPKFFGEKINSKNQKQEMVKFADSLEKNFPDSQIHKTVADLYRSSLPSNQKSEIIKSLVGIDPLKMEQQKRLQAQELRTKYSQRIKEEQGALKEQFNPEERKLTGARIRQLQNERDQILGFEFDNEEYDVPKVKFNPKNPEHIKKFKQLDKEFNGNRKKVNEALAKEFTL